MATDDFVFAVDLDGVCGDYVKAIASVLEDRRGVPRGSLPESSDWNFSNWGISPKDIGSLHQELVVKRRGWRNLDVFDGASAALWRLSDVGVYIRILTHRLGLPGQHSIIASDTVLWLEVNDIPYRDLCFMGAKASNDANIYVDDAPHNIEALTEAGKECIIFDQSYNQGIEGVRAHGWEEVEAIVMKRFDTYEAGGKVWP